MHIPVHPPWLPGYIDTVETVLVILTMAGVFLDRPCIVTPIYLPRDFFTMQVLAASSHVFRSFLTICDGNKLLKTFSPSTALLIPMLHAVTVPVCSYAVLWNRYSLGPWHLQPPYSTFLCALGHEISTLRADTAITESLLNVHCNHRGEPLLGTLNILFPKGHDLSWSQFLWDSTVLVEVHTLPDPW